MLSQEEDLPGDCSVGELKAKLQPRCGHTAKCCKWSPSNGPLLLLVCLFAFLLAYLFASLFVCVQLCLCACLPAHVFVC